MKRLKALIKRTPRALSILIVLLAVSVGVRVGMAYADSGLYTLSGTITSGTEAATNADVDVNNAYIPTDSNGNYTVNNLSNGSYAMQISDGTLPCDNASNPCNESLAVTMIAENNGTNPPSKLIDVNGANVTQNLAIPETVPVTVTVDDSSGNASPGASITANSQSGYATDANNSSIIYVAQQYTNAVSISANATTDSNGQLTINAIPGYTYAICANSAGSNPLQACSTITVNSATSTTIEVPGPTATNLVAPSPTQVPSLSWDGDNLVGGAEYVIYRNGTQIGTSTTPSYTDNSAPTGTNTYYVNIDANGYYGLPSNSVNVVVGTLPTITSTNSASTGMNVPLSFTVTTTGSPTPALTETGSLPSGITFTDNGDGTATIGGTAAVGSSGTYPITITADNGIEPAATQSFTLTVTAVHAAPAITSSSSDTEAFDMPFSFTVTTTGYPVPPSIYRTGALPPGVTFTNNDNGTATIAGTPDGSGSGSGVYTITITAHNSAGTTTQTFTETITKVPVFKFISKADLTATVGTPYSLTVTSSAYNTAAMTETGSLPNGLTFTDNGNGTATISGTPQAGDGGAYPVTVTATNSYGATNDPLTIIVDEAPTITSSSSATATRGTAFSFQVTSTGYPAPKYSLTGTLPLGLHFNDNTGVLSGTARHIDSPDTYDLTITATNSTNSDSQSFTLTLL